MIRLTKHKDGTFSFRTNGSLMRCVLSTFACHCDTIARDHNDKFTPKHWTNRGNQFHELRTACDALSDASNIIEFTL